MRQVNTTILNAECTLPYRPVPYYSVASRHVAWVCVTFALLPFAKYLEAIETTEWKLLRPARHIIILTNVGPYIKWYCTVYANSCPCPGFVQNIHYHLILLVAIASLTLSTTDQAQLLEFHNLLRALP